MAATYDKQCKAYTRVSTHSHPKVAAFLDGAIDLNLIVSTHSHPKVAAIHSLIAKRARFEFQHTATRRWLPIAESTSENQYRVSTHSHPKVAAF